MKKRKIKEKFQKNRKKYTKKDFGAAVRFKLKNKKKTRK